MYCGTDDLIERFGASELAQLTDKDAGQIVQPDVVSAAIEDASNTIDGYIGGRYPLPLNNPPAVLIKICADIARYNLYDNVIPDVVEKQFKAAMDFVKAVGKGEVRLGLSADDQASATSEHIEIRSSGSVFSRDNSKGFI